MLKQCKICSREFETIKNGGSRKYCFDCSPSYNKGDNSGRAATITIIRNALKRELVKRKGGCCKYCGYKRCQSALHFHHRDKTQKEFSISSICSSNNVDVDAAFAEIEKCDLVCANCHAEIHDDFIQETD